MTSETVCSPLIPPAEERQLPEFEPHNCFACGTLNTHGLRLDLHVAAGRAWTEVTLADRFEGWAGIVHGGITATLLDEVMGWALVARERWAVTARLAIDYRRPIPVGSPIRAEGWVIEERKRAIDTAARIVDSSGTELATATAVYVIVPETRRRELADRYQVKQATAGATADVDGGRS